MPVLVVFLILHFAQLAGHQSLKLGLKILGLCVAAYSIFIIQALFNIETVKIIQKYSDKFDIV